MALLKISASILLLLTGCAENPQPFKEGRKVSPPIGFTQALERELDKCCPKKK